MRSTVQLVISPDRRRSCFNLRHLANTPCLQLFRVFIHWTVPCNICRSAAATNKRRQLKHIGTGDGDHKTAQNTTKRSGDQNCRQPSAANNTMHFINYAKKLTSNQFETQQLDEIMRIEDAHTCTCCARLLPHCYIITAAACVAFDFS